jgi:hypothetical protein
MGKSWGRQRKDAPPVTLHAERGREACNDAVLRVAHERAQRQRDEDAVQLRVLERDTRRRGTAAGIY